MKTPKPPKSQPDSELTRQREEAASKAKAEALNQTRLRSAKGYSGTNVRGSLLSQFMKERTGSV